MKVKAKLKLKRRSTGNLEVKGCYDCVFYVKSRDVKGHICSLLSSKGPAAELHCGRYDQYFELVGVE